MTIKAKRLNSVACVDDRERLKLNDRFHPLERRKEHRDGRERARLSCYRPVDEESWRRDAIGSLLPFAWWLILAGDDGDAPTWLFWLLSLLPLLLPHPALPASHAINQPNTN